MAARHLGIFLFNQALDPILHDPLFQAVDDIVQFAGDIAQWPWPYRSSRRTTLQIRHAVGFCIFLARFVSDLETDDDIEFGPVGIAEFLKFGISAEAGQHLDPQPVKKRQHPPQVSGDIVLADQVDRVFTKNRRLGRADDVFEENLTGQAVADVLVADESGSG